MTLLKEMHSKSWAHLKRKREKRKLFIVQTHEKKKHQINAPGEKMLHYHF